MDKEGGMMDKEGGMMEKVSKSVVREKFKLGDVIKHKSIKSGGFARIFAFGEYHTFLIFSDDDGHWFPNAWIMRDYEKPIKVLDSKNTPKLSDEEKKKMEDILGKRLNSEA